MMLTVEVGDDFVGVVVVAAVDGCDVVEGRAAFPPPPLHLMRW